MPYPVWQKMLALLCVALVSAVQAGAAGAEGTAAGAADAAAVQLHGFGTLGISCFSSRDADFVYDTVPNGPGRNGRIGRCDAGLDSMLGAQLDAHPLDAVTASLQVVSQRSPYSTFRPYARLANVRWQVTDTWWLRLGRVSNPLFLESDYRLVRQAMVGVRPPVEVYGLAPTYIMDGLDSSYRFALAEWRVELYGGLHMNDIRARGDNTSMVRTYAVRDMKTLSLSAERPPWTFKLGYNTDRVSYNNPRTDLLFGALRALQAVSLADDLSIIDTPVHILSAGLRYDDNVWQVQAEVVERDFKRSYFRSARAAYLTAGRRFGVWMPYLTLARRHTSGPAGDSRTPPLLGSYVQELLAATRYDQSSLTLGVSREIGKSMVGKLQAQWLRPDQGSWGTSLANFAPGYDPRQPVRGVLVSASLDFLF
jgi:hypothetical protein